MSLQVRLANGNKDGYEICRDGMRDMKMPGEERRLPRLALFYRDEISILWQRQVSVLDSGEGPLAMHRTVDGIEVQCVVEVVPLDLPLPMDVDVVDNQ